MSFAVKKSAFDAVVRIPLNVYSFVFIFPYRFEWCPTEELYKCRSSLFRTIVCGVLYLTSLGSTTYSALKYFPLILLPDDTADNSGPSPSGKNHFFSLLGAMTGYCIPFIVAWISWKCRHPFSVLVNDFKRIQSTSIRIVLLSGCLSLAPFISTLANVHGEVLTNRNVFYVGAHSILAYYKEGRLYYSFIYYFLMSIFYSALFIQHMLNSLFEAYGLLIAVSVIIYVNNFVKEMEICDDVNEAYFSIAKLRNFTDLCNERMAMSSLMLISFIDSIIGYSQLIEKLLFQQKEKNDSASAAVIAFLSSLPFLMIVITTWLISAEVHQKIYTGINKWIRRQHLSSHLSTRDHLKILAIGDDLHREPIGISGRFFSVSYAFISSTIGIMVSFILIANQLSPSTGTAPAAHDTTSSFGEDRNFSTTFI